MLQITFRSMATSESLCALAKERLDAIRAQCTGAVHCRAVIVHREAEPMHKPEQFSAHVELVFDREGAPIGAQAVHAEPNAALREAFTHVERMLARRLSRPFSLHGRRSLAAPSAGTRPSSA